MIALASEYHLLTPLERQQVTILICDDGDWSEEQIEAAVANVYGPDKVIFYEDDWTKK